MKRSSLFLSMVLCLALLALVISPVAPALAQSQLVEGLEGQNFRDLAVDEVITPGLIYRAGHLADLDVTQIGIIEASLGINTVIDLRTNTDKMRDGIQIGVDQHGNPVLPAESWLVNVMEGTLNPLDADTWQGHNVEGDWTEYSVPFTQGEDLKEFVWTPHLWDHQTTDPRHYNILLWSMSWDISGVDFDNWYVSLLEDNKDEIGAVFDELAIPGNYPIVFHCTQGKDRAGVISALVLSLLGLPREAIIADYMATGDLMASKIYQQNMAIQMVMMMSENPESDLYRLVPPNVELQHWMKMNGVYQPAMENLLDHLDNSYGGVERFLVGIGITPAQLVNIKGQLLPPNTPAGIGVTVDLDFGANVLFSWVTTAGYTGAFAQLNNPGVDLPEGVQVVGAYVNVSTTATYAGPIIVGLNYPQGTSQPKKLTMYQWTGDNWEDVPTYVDPSTRTVYGMVNSLSWFFIGSK